MDELVEIITSLYLSGASAGCSMIDWLLEGKALQQDVTLRSRGSLIIKCAVFHYLECSR